ncbi:hypothetical protein [Patiriisocius hiemis]|uniref:Uncharacterized protein n=1 Tax=Patiriisocius hiemis TaxID=3075604 RepID=A0ABU2YGI6_9FLAO|nr:hypothetical protein [Constantimarinum sp. W242]MDT0556890.1 hypothetical protein [Constantimarinum sp. W242]
MKQQFTLLALLFIITFSSAQKSLSDYSFVVVPDQFEFLKEKNQYRLNEMAHFYLDKYGFNAYRINELPAVDKCEGLYVNLEKNNKLLKLGLELIFKDCNGNEVYRSARGITSFKEWERAYPDALRNAFKSFEDVDINQIMVSGINNNSTKVIANTTNTEIIKPREEIEVEKELPIVTEKEVPSAKFIRYTSNSNTFLLRKTAAGFSLYQDNSTSGEGLVLKGTISSNSSSMTFKTEDGKLYDAYFDASNNLTIFKGDTPVFYKKMN